MRVLIAGATGVIGRQAAHRLAAAGHEVIGLSRSPRPSLEAKHLTADLLDAGALAAAVRSAAPDAVVHLATAIPDPINPRHIARDMAPTNRLRTEGTANLIAAARAAGAGRIIAQSLAYAYDPAAEAICDEDQPLWQEPPRQYAPAVAALRELEVRVLDADGLVLRLGHPTDREARTPLTAPRSPRSTTAGCRSSVMAGRSSPSPTPATPRWRSWRPLTATCPACSTSSTTTPPRCACGSPR